MKSIWTSIIAAAVILLATTAHAGEYGTPEEAKAMVEEAMKFHKENGIEALTKEITAKDSRFKKKDLYVFIAKLNGVMLAHGAVPALNGKNLYNLKDVTGTFIAREMIKVATEKGSGWVEYKWPNPKTKKIQDKVTYVSMLAEKYYIAVGAYKKAQQ